MVPDCIFLPMVQEDRLGQQLQEVPAHPERANRNQQAIKTYYNMPKLMHGTYTQIYRLDKQSDST